MAKPPDRPATYDDILALPVRAEPFDAIEIDLAQVWAR